MKPFLLLTVITLAILSSTFSVCSYAKTDPSNNTTSSQDKQPSEENINYELELYKGTVTLLSLLTSVVALVFGGLLAINVFSGNRVIKDATKELNSIKESRDQYQNSFNAMKIEVDDILEKTINDIRQEAKTTLKLMVDHEYEFSTIRKYKEVLIEELMKDAPDAQAIYYRLTDIINYPDSDSFRIYQLCIEKFSRNEDIMKVIVLAQEQAGKKLPDICSKLV